MNSINSLWYTNNQSKNGINPPEPSVITSKFSEFSSQKNNGQNEKTKNIWTISSPRIPYGVDFLNNGYGSLSMTLGTNLGKN